MYIVVCYDITDNGQRARLYELLLGYGTPVQKSVFECNLDKKQFNKMRKEAPRYAKKGDSIRYYQLCMRCQQRTMSDGTGLGEKAITEDFMV